ncbi:MAG TPA: universal stress protein [Xanthobacteraceae bacterium]|nr:universal stress protein [Xanthobacteraceae bacterium]
MGLASIMVHVGADTGTQGRVDIARSLATRFNAGLIGIAGQAPPAMFSGDIVGEVDHRGGGDFVEGDEIEQPDTTAIVSWLAALANDFRQKAEPNTNVTFRSAVAQPTAFIVREARAADLVILGRAAASDITERAVDPANVLVHCGRPLLVVPEAVGTLSAERIVVGWKETREARRAVRDALALLKSAKEVTIAAIEEAGQSVSDSGPLDDVAAYLARHGVSISATLTRRFAGSVSGGLAAIAGEKGADLIVVGGYGHGRLSEWIWGGVTRDLLETCPACCLLSH